MRLYESTLPNGDRRLIVHFDERKLDDDGLPHPDWCVEAVHAPYDEENPPMTGAESEWDRADGDPPMRAMSREEVEEQQEREVIAIAREALASSRAEEDQARAATDPFANGRKV